MYASGNYSIGTMDGWAMKEYLKRFSRSRISGKNRVLSNYHNGTIAPKFVLNSQKNSIHNSIHEFGNDVDFEDSNNSFQDKFTKLSTGFSSGFYYLP